MKIINKFAPASQFISLEFFPPKEHADWPAFFQTVDSLAQKDPLFVSVTYGAGGSTHKDTLEIVSRMKRDYSLECMAHLTCIHSTVSEVALFLENLASAGIDNVLALRGDPPQDSSPDQHVAAPLRHASDLVDFINRSFPGFGIGVAAYPETHPESVSSDSDLDFLRLKFDNGADFAVTQLFFDNRYYHELIRRTKEKGVGKPVIPGILPVVSLKVIKRIVSLCGATIPADFLADLESADARGGAAAVRSVGVAHARKQIQELLASGVPGVHIYTLNRAEVVEELLEGISR